MSHHLFEWFQRQGFLDDVMFSRFAILVVP